MQGSPAQRGFILWGSAKRFVLWSLLAVALDRTAESQNQLLSKAVLTFLSHQEREPAVTPAPSSITTLRTSGT
jgi:hypothetical protein